MLARFWCRYPVASAARTVSRSSCVRNARISLSSFASLDTFPCRQTSRVFFETSNAAICIIFPPCFVGGGTEPIYALSCGLIGGPSRPLNPLSTLFRWAPDLLTSLSAKPQMRHSKSERPLAWNQCCHRRQEHTRRHNGWVLGQI